MVGKRWHLHLNCRPRSMHQSARPVRLREMTDTGCRRPLIDPIAYLAHRVMTDALEMTGLAGRCCS